MSNIKQLFPENIVRREASEWISKIDRGLRTEEETELQQWAALSDEHFTVLMSIAATWDDLSALNELSALFPLASRNLTSNSSTSQQIRYYRPTLWGLAASMVFVAASMTGVISFSEHPTVTNELVAFEKNTLLGELAPVELPDGSMVTLNTSSKIRINYSEEERSVELLSGEAYFDVAHDKSRPFIVNIGERSLVAVGTAFNVRHLSDDNVELLVTEGKVLISESGELGSKNLNAAPISYGNYQGALVVAGEMAKVSEFQISTLTDYQIEKVMAWQKGMLVFQGEELEKALMEVTRYSNVNFVITDELIRRKRVAGYFKAGDIEGLLFALENNFDIRHSKLGETTIKLTMETKH